MTKQELQNTIASIPWNVIAANVEACRMEVYRWKTGKAFPSGEKLLKLIALIEEQKKQA